MIVLFRLGLFIIVFFLISFTLLSPLDTSNRPFNLFMITVSYLQSVLFSNKKRHEILAPFEAEKTKTTN